MSMIPKCCVCDQPVAGVYAPSSWCERCLAERDVLRETARVVPFVRMSITVSDDERSGSVAA